MDAVADILRNTDPDSRGEVLERLTHAHAEMMERHGPMLGMEGVKPPTGAKTFEAEQARLAALQDAEVRPSLKMDLMLERTARDHEQIGRLASYVAAYELTHGDPNHAPAMMELGGSHFDLAVETRAAKSSPHADLMAPDLMDKLRAERTNQNDRASPGHGL